MKTATALLLAMLCAAGPTAAQSPFSPVATVNDRVITGYEVDQRARMLGVFRTPGDLRQQALDALIDERLQLTEAKRLGIAVTEGEIVDGMAEFAGRADLDTDAFVAALAGDGVDVQTFRDFVAAGIAWRKAVRAQFAGRVSVPEAEVDRAARQIPRASLAASLSEIILPANTPENAARTEEIAPQVLALSGEDAFAAAARQVSASPSRERGGRIDPIPLTNLPPALRALVTEASPGQVVGPLPLPNALAFFLVRGIDEVPASGAVTQIDYATYAIPGGRSPEALAEAAALRARVDTCGDLYTVARGQPDRLRREKVTPSQVPNDIALELAKLDEDEVSLALTRANGQTLLFLMLCDRSYADPATEIDRDRLRSRLVDARAADLARNYLAELRANAHIVRE
ncbi:peptidyl-prolyl cis-trans isomerase domain-containing protein [Oceaniovalibus guishaninsula JLT2003]|uniref:Parvulin-like PPIase n=1 Tax=Oceaniovalibus guishaninsula JLT2003 TaxID=1231392 RepID=K2HHA5_9RHOB|nr:SurA N-terminal domain-containing protein [Oceaniovalibus guishaninsula]EKE45817.1 peptidyl-prolyl cis-trans isomerase domain-containing protein [Oceaniovalibus guishaninsula JLT2003]